MPAPRGPRLPNKSQWALEDAMAVLDDAHGSLEAILTWCERQREEAKGHMDSRRQARLGELDHIVARLALQMSKIDRSVRAARRGEYEERE